MKYEVSVTYEEAMDVFSLRALKEFYVKQMILLDL